MPNTRSYQGFNHNAAFLNAKASQNNYREPTLQLPHDYNCLKDQHVIITVHLDIDRNIHNMWIDNINSSCLTELLSNAGASLSFFDNW